MEEKISGTEPISRFIVEKKYYRADGTARHNSFMPSREGETSVYRTQDLKEDEIFEIGSTYVAEKRNKPLKGRADIQASHVFDQSLNILPQPEVHDRHCSIVDWPEDKSKIRQIAVELAEKATLKLIS